jgi:hypothetical protein
MFSTPPVHAAQPRPERIVRSSIFKYYRDDNNYVNPAAARWRLTRRIGLEELSHSPEK